LQKADAERKQKEEKAEADRRRRESQIIVALEDKRYKWRTVQKISHQLKVPETEVLTQLKELIGKGVVIQSTIPDKDGNDLFTTRKHFEQRG
jgi:predicted ArsR family transcriptional regulator